MRNIYANNQTLTIDRKYAFLGAAAASGDGTLTLESIVGFAINQVLLIGEWGGEKSEVVKTHASTAPSGSTVTLSANISFDHPIGTRVTIIDFDQAEFSHATTTGGSKTVMNTISLQADSLQTLYQDSTYSSGYYFIRFKNSITTTYSDYSDPIPWGGFEQNTVGAAISYALKRNKQNGFTDNVTHDFCVEEINSCLLYIRGKLKKWHRLQSFDYVLGQLSRGSNVFALPSDMWQYSNKSVLGVRVGIGDNMQYLDKREWVEEMRNVANSTSSAASSGATSITLANSYNFASAGTVLINGMSITYTANDTSTGILSGIPASGSGSITSSITSGDQVWQGTSEGEPIKYTIYGGNLYTWPLANSTYAGKNVITDYWLEAPSIDSDSDTIDMLRYDMVKFWLTWAIRMQLKYDGERNYDDGDWKAFEQILSDAIKIEQNHGQKFKMKPKLNGIDYGKGKIRLN